MRHTIAVAALASLLCVVGCKSDPAKPEYWSDALQGGKRTADRVRVAEDLRKFEGFTPALFPMIQKEIKEQPAAEVKAALVVVLGEKKDTSAIPTLTESIAFGSTDLALNGLNKEIAIAFGRIGDKSAVPTLLKMMKLRDQYTQIEAINSLGLLKAKEAVEPLMALAEDDQIEPYITKRVVISLGDIGDARAVPVLFKLMFKERRGKSFYMESSYALYQIGPASAETIRPIVEGKATELEKWAEENRVIVPALYAKAAQVLGDLHDMNSEKALISKLGFESDYLDRQLFVRMHMADALGRMRSKAAVAKLSSLLQEEDSNARQGYIRSLVRIGDKQAVNALAKAAVSGVWDSRQPAIVGLSLLGDDVSAFEKLAKEEDALTKKECKENSEAPICADLAGLTKKRIDRIAELKAGAAAGKECASDAACWSKKLSDSVPVVRERAAFELGRSGKAEYVDALTSALKEENRDTRLAIIQGIDWLVYDNKEAAALAKKAIPALDKQLEQEKGKVQFVKVNEDLRRLAVLLKRDA